MAVLNKCPIVFPLSNPVSLSEVDYVNAVEWYVTPFPPIDLLIFRHRTNGQVIFASGSPYKPVEYKGKTYEPGQGNNMYIFPGIGLGSILCKARTVTDAMVEEASIALSRALDKDEREKGLVYPRLGRIRDISAQIAAAVIRKAQADVSRERSSFESTHRFGLDRVLMNMRCCAGQVMLPSCNMSSRKCGHRQRTTKAGYNDVISYICRSVFMQTSSRRMKWQHSRCHASIVWSTWSNSTLILAVFHRMI
jgi:hypothetical protein